ncbi:MAG TPA: methyl-accepting chemotaxis protein [Rhodocyclaceae bacterium]|nr:methyl-accepting chemotaxis protein [Rhodocyclaceae bacterium]
MVTTTEPDIPPVDAVATAPAPRRKRSRFLRLPLLAGLEVMMQVQVLAAAFLLFVVAGAFVAFQDSRTAGRDGAQLAVVGEMRTLGPQLARATQGALTGQAAAMTDLRVGRDRFAELLSTLANGGQHKGQAVPPISPSLYTEVEELRAQWDRMDRNLQVLLIQEKPLVALGKLVSDITEQSPKAADLGNDAGGSLPLLVERIGRNSTLFLTLTAVDEAPFAQLARDITAAVDTAGKSTKQQELHTLLLGWQTALQPIGAEIKPLLQAKQAAGNVLRQGAGLRDATDKVGNSLEDNLNGRGSHLGVIASFAAGGLLMLVLMVKIISEDATERRVEAEHRRQEAEAANAEAQIAIARLTSELSDLRTNDFTARATIVEGPTAAVAATVNATVEQLAALVHRIDGAAARIDTAARQASDTSESLLVGADTQSDQIREVNGQALSVSATLGQIATQATESAQTLLRARDSADQGATAVDKAIININDLARQVGGASRRMRRAGDSSQQIGEAVEQLATIAEQTNVLALNAAIQAVSAGETGRAFSVVAEEVQRLTERSSEIIKQIAALVRAIRADVGEALGTLDRNTQAMTDGVQSSEDAGQVFAEMSGVAQVLAQTMDGIAATARRQSDTTREIVEGVKEVERLTDEAVTGIRQTAQSVNGLTELADELKGSVGGFKV